MWFEVGLKGFMKPLQGRKLEADVTVIGLTSVRSNTPSFEEKSKLDSESANMMVYKPSDAW